MWSKGSKRRKERKGWSKGRKGRKERKGWDTGSKGSKERKEMMGGRGCMLHDIVSYGTPLRESSPANAALPVRLCSPLDAPTAGICPAGRMGRAVGTRTRTSPWVRP